VSSVSSLTESQPGDRIVPGWRRRVPPRLAFRSAGLPEQSPGALRDVDAYRAPGDAAAAADAAEAAELIHPGRELMGQPLRSGRAGRVEVAAGDLGKVTSKQESTAGR